MILHQKFRKLVLNFWYALKKYLLKFHIANNIIMSHDVIRFQWWTVKFKKEFRSFAIYTPMTTLPIMLAVDESWIEENSSYFENNEKLPSNAIIIIHVQSRTDRNFFFLKKSSSYCMYTKLWNSKKIVFIQPRFSFLSIGLGIVSWVVCLEEKKQNASGKSTREKGIGLKVFSYYFSIFIINIYIERPCF